MREENRTSLQKILENQITNVILYGNSGVGKTHAFQSIFGFPTEKLVVTIDGDEYKENSKYLRFDGRTIANNKMNLADAISNITSTRNVTNTKKVIFVKNFNLLSSDTQEQFREIIENNFDTAIFVITTSNINSIDSAIISRCFVQKIKQTNEEMQSFMKSHGITNTDVVREILKVSHNYNIIRTMIKIYNIKHELVDVNRILADELENEMKSCNDLNDLLKIVEKYFSFYLDMSQICKYIKSADIQDLIDYETSTKSFNDLTILLFKAFKRNS